MTKSAESIDTVRVTYVGRVQGVGFRYTVAQLAQEYSIVGWVRNAFDGSVELVASAQSDQLKAFLTAIQNRMQHHIRNLHLEPSVLGPQVSGFEIRR